MGPRDYEIIIQFETVMTPELIAKIESLIRQSGQKRRGERSNRDRAAADLLQEFRASLKEIEERNLLAEVMAYCKGKNRRLEFYTRAPTQLTHQAFKIVDRLFPEGP